MESLSILSIKDVLAQSGISLKNKNTLLIYSTTKGNVDLLENSKPSIPNERTYLSKMAEAIGNYFEAVNSPLVVSNACISGLLAIIVAKRMISEGLYENIIVCGGDLVTEFTVSGFKSFNALSNSLCKPFDARRDGINLGEAVSAILITGNKNHLSANSTQILSGASANDANHISGPSRNGDGLLLAILRTFAQHKHILPDTINAHGTATPYNDEMESIALAKILAPAAYFHPGNMGLHNRRVITGKQWLTEWLHGPGLWSEHIYKPDCSLHRFRPWPLRYTLTYRP